MSKTKRTLAGPAHDVPALFSMASDGELLPPPAHDLLSLHRTVERAAELCQAVMATCRRSAGESEGDRIAAHFGLLRDRLAAQLHAIDAYVFGTGQRRPRGEHVYALLALVQSDLDHYRRHRTCPSVRTFL